MPSRSALARPIHLERQADVELARRCSTAIVIYPAFLLILFTFTSYYADHPRLFTWVAGGTVLLNGIRLPLSRRLDSTADDGLRRWRTSFSVVTVSNGLLWGFFLAWTLFTYGYASTPSSILLVSVAGAAAGSVTAHGSHLAVVYPYVSSLLVPSMLVHAGLVGGDAGAGMFLIFLLYLGFLVEQARRNNGVYWKMLIDDDQLRARTIELEQARAAAEQANEAKSAFLANVTHELRTPLNAIIGYTEMLIEDSAEGVDEARSATDDLGRVLAAAKHQLRLVNELLDFAKVEAGRLEVQFAPYDFLAMTTQVAETIRPLAARNGNQLEVALPESIDPVTGDELRTSQSLYNLLSNACKFTHSGVVRLSVDTVSRDGRRWVECRVADTGIGITQEQMGQLFQPFYQADNTNARRYGGTGLGLALTHDLCALMGGTVEVESLAGEGSTFTIRLPVRAATRAG